MNACLTLMFSFVQPGRTGFLLGVWGAGYAYSCGLATISGGGLLTSVSYTHLTLPTICSV